MFIFFSRSVKPLKIRKNVLDVVYSYYSESFPDVDKDVLKSTSFNYLISIIGDDKNTNSNFSYACSFLLSPVDIDNLNPFYSVQKIDSNNKLDLNLFFSLPRHLFRPKEYLCFTARGDFSSAQSIELFKRWTSQNSQTKD